MNPDFNMLTYIEQGKEAREKYTCGTIEQKVLIGQVKKMSRLARMGMI